MQNEHRRVLRERQLAETRGISLHLYGDSYDHKQLREIWRGLEKGLDVNQYDSVENNHLTMRSYRYYLTNLRRFTDICLGVTAVAIIGLILLISK